MESSETENAAQDQRVTTDPTVLNTESLVQPHREFNLSEIAEELAGDLVVPDVPEISAGYADIYHGVWTSPQGDQVEVAVKELKALIPKDRQTDREALKKRTDTRMKREVFVWSQVKHPNLHPLLGYVSQPKPRLISRWCHHGNLKDYLRGNPELSRLDKLRLIHQAAYGLDHLHSQSPPICHADIKPENVLINDDYEAELSDFGLSRVLQGLGGPSGFTTSETPKGTLNYMAGELFNVQKPKQTCETDVYAFGGLILAVMSGNPPLFGLGLHQIMIRTMNHQPPNPEDHPNLPSSDPLWGVMRRCWDKNPAARPTIREVRWELWSEICREQSNSSSITRFSPVAGVSDGEYSDMDLDTPHQSPRGGILALQDANPGPADDSPLSILAVEEMHHPTPAGALLEACRIFESLKPHCKLIPVIGSYLRAFAEVGSSLVQLAPTISGHGAMFESMELSTWKLACRLENLREQSTSRQVSEIVACITDIRSEVEVVQGKIKEWSTSDQIRDPSHSVESLTRCQRVANKVLEEIQLILSLNTASLVTEFGKLFHASLSKGMLMRFPLENIQGQKEQRQLLDRLGDGSYGARGSSIEDVICLPDTRVDILERIDKWARGKSASERVLWIRGMAGRGKSTIASTVAHNWMYRASCAIFHFRRGQNATDHNLICALTRQLGKSLVTEVRNAIMESVRETEDIAKERLDEQFKTLFVGALGKLKDQVHPILIIVDALDEWDSVSDTVRFVKLIDKHSMLLPTNVKFLLTCRPEAPILVALETRHWRVEDLDSAPEILTDISRLIQHACVQIREDYNLPKDWPHTDEVWRLAEMSQGLFQWASSALAYLRDGSPAHRLRELLRRPSAWSGLDDFYHQVLSKAFNEKDPTRRQLLSWALGALVVAPHPISLEVMAFLHADHEIFEDQDNIIEFLRMDILSNLNSLLHIPTSPDKPMRFMHTSIHDFISSPHHLGRETYFIHLAQNNLRLAGVSLRVMNRELRHNICNLSDLSKPNIDVQDIVQIHVSKGLQYCCRSWSIHLIEGASWSENDAESLRDILIVLEPFSQQKLLYWLEVMSLIGATVDAYRAAMRTYQWLLASI